MSALRDRLSSVSPKAAMTTAFVALDAIQALPAAEQVAGIWTLAFAFARDAGLDVSNLLNQTERRFADGDTFYQREGKALVEYIKEEVRG